jgi:hypothetical protein
MSLLFLFFASFFNVFLLGLNSQFVRDQRVAMVFVLSWGISSSQFVFTRVIAITPNPGIAFLAAGFGGSLGICSSIYFYRWFNPRFSNWRNAKGFCL